MELSHDDVKKILEIIDRAEHLDEIEYLDHTLLDRAEASLKKS